MSAAQRRWWVGLVVGLVLSPGAAIAAGLTLTAGRGRIGLEDRFEVEVALAGTPVGASEPQLELGGNFQVLGTSKSQSISFINGQTVVEVRFRYTLEPRRAGIFDVGPARVSTRDGELQSGTVRVQVIAGSVVPRRPAQRPRSWFEDPWDPIGRGQRRRRAERGKVLLLASVDRERAFVGERVTYELRLLTQIRVSGIKPRSEPQFTGLWTEPLEVPDPPDPQDTRHDGEAFTSYLLKRVALFPTTAGAVTIEPAVWDVTIVVADFLLADTEVVARSTLPIEVEVQALPTEGRPAEFDGAVGRFDVDASLDKAEAEVDDALLLRVTVAGEGNLSAIPTPRLPPLTDFRLYSSSGSPPESDKGVLPTERTWEFVLVAKAPGEHTIPPIEYAYFDPLRRAYGAARSSPIEVRIDKGDVVPPVIAAAGATTAGVSQRRVEPVRRDIAYLKLSAPDLGSGTRPLHQRRAAKLLLSVPVLLNLAGLVLLWSRRREPCDPTERRRRDAYGTARRRLKQAAADLTDRNRDTFASSVEEAVTGWVADRFGEPRAGLTRDRIRDLLGQHARDGGKRFGLLLDRIDYLRFTPAAGSDGERRRILKEARVLLEALDRALAREGRR